MKKIHADEQCLMALRETYMKGSRILIERQNEKKQENPIYQMPVQIAQLNTKVYDLIKSYINEGNHE